MVVDKFNKGIELGSNEEDLMHPISAFKEADTGLSKAEIDKNKVPRQDNPAWINIVPDKSQSPTTPESSPIERDSFATVDPVSLHTARSRSPRTRFGCQACS